MILLLDTSTPTAKLTLIVAGETYIYEWQAERQLAKGLLGWITECLDKHNLTIQELKGIGALRGPGSFTGLRIGLTVLNTLADGMKIPIVGATGEAWQDEAIALLIKGESHRIVLPLYDREANITKQRK